MKFAGCLFSVGCIGLFNCGTQEPDSSLVFPQAVELEQQSPAGSVTSFDPIFKWRISPEFNRERPFWVVALAHEQITAADDTGRISSPSQIFWMWSPDMEVEGEIPEIQFSQGRKVEYVDGRYDVQFSSGTLESGRQYHWAVWALNSSGKAVASSPSLDFVYEP